MRSVILGTIIALSLSLFEIFSVYWKRNLVGDTVYSERIISWLSLRILL